MGANQATLTKRWAEQQKFVRLNRKQDGRSKYKPATEATLNLIFAAIQDQYPFLNSISDSACVTDHSLSDEPIIYANREFTDLTGYASQEILGRNCRFLQGKYSDPAEVAKIRDALDTGTRLEVKLLNYRKDGTPFLNEFVLLPLSVASLPGKGSKSGKNVTHFIAIQKDVTVLVNPFKQPMPQWTCPEVCMWFDKIQAKSYISSILEHGITGEQLSKMQPGDLESLGVVLGTEQSRISKLINQHGRGIQNLMSQSELSLTSMMDSSMSDIDDSRTTDFGDVSASIDDELLKLKKRGSRKVFVEVVFPQNVRPPTKMIISGADASLKSITRSIRKAFGRAYEVQSMVAADGQKSKVRLTLGFPPMTNQDYFVLMEGVPQPIIVTDVAAMTVFANDYCLQELDLDEDPTDCYLANVLKFGASEHKLLDNLRNMKSKVKVSSASQEYVAYVSEVRVHKETLFVWTFKPKE